MSGCRYIQDKDLEFFKERVEQPGDLKGAGPWEHMVYKDFGSFTYEAWRRSLAVSLQSDSKGAWLLCVEEHHQSCISPKLLLHIESCCDLCAWVFDLALVSCRTARQSTRA